jgi:phosphate transport system protein
MVSHYEETLQRDAELIRRKVVEMAGLADRALQDSLRAVLERNHQLAYAVILRDPRIDELEKQIDRLCLEFLVRQQPVAGHLRFAYAAIKINTELERIGDYAESIVRQFLKVQGAQADFSTERLEAMAELSIPMLRDAVQAFVTANPDLARATMAVEEKVDDLRKEIDADLLEAARAGRVSLDALIPWMTIVRRFERVTDQAKNICEEVLYMCTGEYSKHRGGEAVRVLFVDQHHGCRSLMAEAIALSLGLPGFIFSSAGLSPRPADARTVQFLQTKGIDISRQGPRRLEQVPNLDFYQVFIALDRAGAKAFPPRPNKTVCLEWTGPDPSAVQGTPAEVSAAYEAAFQEIQTQMKALAEAIVGTNNE